MKRFYNRAITVLKKTANRELAEGIENYVEHLEHEKRILVAELHKSHLISAKILLQRDRKSVV